MTGVRNALTRKLGPLPAWAWLGIFTVAVYFYRNRGGGLGGTTADTVTGQVDATQADPQDVTTLEPGESAYDPNTGSLFSTAPEQQTPGEPQVLEPHEGVYDPATGRLIEPPTPAPTHKPKPKPKPGRHKHKPRGKHPKPHKHHGHAAKPPTHGKHRAHGHPDVKMPRAHSPRPHHHVVKHRHPHPEPSPTTRRKTGFARIARFTTPATTRSTESMRDAAVSGSVRGTSRQTRPTQSHTVNSAAPTGNRTRQRPIPPRSGVVRQRPVAAHTAPRQAQVAQRNTRSTRGRRK